MNVSGSPVDDSRHRRQRLVVIAAIALVVVFTGGAIWAVSTVQDDLTDKVAARLADNGVSGVAVRFSGLDGILRCATPLADPVAVQRTASGIKGVRDIVLDPECFGAAPSSGTDPSLPATPDSTPDSTPDNTPDNTPGSPPSSTSTTVLRSDQQLSVALADGALTLSGSVESDAQILTLVGAADQALNPQYVISKLAVDSSVAVDASTLKRVATLTTAMPAGLVSGDLSVEGSTVRVNGVYVDAASRANFERVASGVDVTPALQARAIATPADGRLLQKALNDFVTANPILFESNKAVLVPSTTTLLDRIAVMARQLAGTKIEVQGHTDNTGDPVRNLKLSQARADAVALALIARGVPAEQLIAKGYGVTEPKVPNTSTANKAINRRVEFVVTTK